MMFEISSSSVIPTLPTATPRQSTFFSWNLMVDFTSLILPERSSEWDIGVGNLPAVVRRAKATDNCKCPQQDMEQETRNQTVIYEPLERAGPRRRGTCLITVSEATKASYLRASFLISFLFLLSFFRSSADMASTP